MLTVVNVLYGIEDFQLVDTMKARDIPIGGRFRLNGKIYIRVAHTLYLPTYRDWSETTGPSVPSRDHVLAVSLDWELIVVHPDNTLQVYVKQ